MRRLWDFHGGIHPPEQKRQSTGQPIRFAGLPPYLLLPLRQTTGPSARPVVATGQRVLKGELIAEAEGPGSLPLHAPTSGRITAIAEGPVPHPSGLADLCIRLEPDGEDRWRERNPRPDYRELPAEELIGLIRNQGVAGLGGAGFPTAVKLAGALKRPIETLVINGVECEPYITADDLLMRERAGEIIEGVRILIHLLSPRECLIAVEDNKPRAIQALREACRGLDGLEIVEVPTKYPSGGERQLITLLTGREVPSGGLPADIGVLCQNVATAAAVYRAVCLDEPLISRITTLTGAALASPANLEALLGTPIGFLLDQCGLDRNRLDRLIHGGPMMGFTLDSLEVPVIKTSNCIIAATAEELPRPAPERACIRCGQCAEVCPARLLPQQLYWFARSGDLEQAERHHLPDCIECGACAYVCPSEIPLVQYYRHAKGALRQARQEQAQADRARARFEFRQQRLQREQAEKEARRLARTQAVAADAAQAPSSQAEETAPPSTPAPSPAATAAPRPEPPAAQETRSDAEHSKAAVDKAAAIQAAIERARARKEAARAKAAPPSTDSEER